MTPDQIAKGNRLVEADASKLVVLQAVAACLGDGYMNSQFICSNPQRFSKIGGREEQQDYCDFLIVDKLQCGCWVVADGLGGHTGGTVASRLAVCSILDSFAKRPEVSGEALRSYIESAHKAILAQQECDRRLSSMQTTVVTLLLSPTMAIWGYVGDSRLYHFRKDRIIYVSKDHSVTQALVDAGKIHNRDIRFNVNRNRLLRSLGTREELQPEIAEIRRHEPEDCFLLCTDGFWEHVWEEEMEADLQKANGPNQWLESLEGRLLRRVTGEFDNYSALAVFIR